LTAQRSASFRSAAKKHHQALCADIIRLRQKTFLNDVYVIDRLNNTGINFGGCLAHHAPGGLHVPALYGSHVVRVLLRGDLAAGLSVVPFL
jgi:hypothetical protein